MWASQGRRAPIRSTLSTSARTVPTSDSIDGTGAFDGQADPVEPACRVELDQEAARDGERTRSRSLLHGQQDSRNACQARMPAAAGAARAPFRLRRLKRLWVVRHN